MKISLLDALDSKEICEICDINSTVRLVITLGYPLDEAREKKRKSVDDLVSEIE